MDPTLAPSWFDSSALSYPTSQPYQQDPWAGAYGSAQQQQQDLWSYYFGAPAAPQQQGGRRPQQSQMQKFGQAGLNMLTPPKQQMPYGMTPTPDYHNAYGRAQSPIPLPDYADPFRSAQMSLMADMMPAPPPVPTRDPRGRHVLERRDYGMPPVPTLRPYDPDYREPMNSLRY